MVIRDAESEQPRLEEIPQMHLDKHLRFLATETGHDEHTIERLLEEIHNEPLSNRHLLPQWRLYVLPIGPKPNREATEYRIAFAASHALTDGMSGFIFHSTFLEALQSSCQLPTDTASIYETTSSCEKLPMSLDLAVPLPISTPYLLRMAANEVLSKRIVKWLGLGSSAKTDVWLGAPSRPERPENRELLQTAVRIAFVSKQIVQKALHACRRHDARLTGLINRLVGYALADSLASRQLTYSTFGVQTAIDLRRCIPDSGIQMANYFSTVAEVVEVDTNHGEALTFSDNDWEAVRRSTEQLKEKSSSLVDQSVALLKYVGNIQEWTFKRGKNPPADSWTTSNLGVFHNRANNGEINDAYWNVKDIALSQTGNGVGEPLSINVATVEVGPLSLVICWEPTTLGVHDEKAFVEEICTFLVRGLEVIGDE